MLQPYFWWIVQEASEQSSAQPRNPTSMVPHHWLRHIVFHKLCISFYIANNVWNMQGCLRHNFWVMWHFDLQLPDLGRPWNHIDQQGKKFGNLYISLKVSDYSVLLWVSDSQVDNILSLETDLSQFTRP